MKNALRSAGLWMLCVGVFAGCGSADRSSGEGRAQGGGTTTSAAAAAPGWAIALHGGAGVIPTDSPPEKVRAYEAALSAALADGAARVERGDAALDVVEAVVRRLEDEPLFNAGKGAVFTAAGAHELDASIMDGRTLACGAVAGVKTVKNPIGLARLVMEKTRHVLLAAEGAEAFATEAGVERVPNTWFDTDARRASWEAWRREQAAAPAAGSRDRTFAYGTVGCVVRDRSGRLAAATSTGGMTGKKFGRVGDSPVIGAGTYANDATCAVSCTGTGEEFIRHGVARDIHARMAYGGASLSAAVEAVVGRTLRPDDGGLIAVDRDGRVVMDFNSDGMFRAAATEAGVRIVKIWR